MAAKKKSRKVAPKKRVARRPVKKTAASKTRPPAKKKSASKKRAPAQTKKRAAKKTTARKTSTAKKSSGGQRGGNQRPLNEHGYVIGSDTEAACLALLEGGVDRNEINDNVESVIGSKTSTGGRKNVPAIVSGVFNELMERGYTVESYFQVIPPAKGGRRKKS